MKRNYIECDMCRDIVEEGVLKKTYLTLKKVEFNVLGFDNYKRDFHICIDCLKSLKNIIKQEKSNENEKI